MVSVKTKGRKIDFEGTRIAGSTAYFFVVSLKFIFKYFIKIQQILRNTNVIENSEKSSDYDKLTLTTRSL